MYHRHLVALAAATALSVSAYAQYDAPNQPAPVQRAYANTSRRAPAVRSFQAAQGVWVRSTAPVTTVARDPERTELRVDHGIANITLSDPQESTIVLVDLPGGQTQLMKNGLYTFNAVTNTVRVVRGGAEVYAGVETRSRKVEEAQYFTFGRDSHAQDFAYRYERTDLLNGAGGYGNGYNQGQYAQQYQDGPVYRDDGYAAPYGYYAPYPYYSYGYGYPGWGWGYPYGYGFGLGFGYYGGGWGRGFYGGGIRIHR